MRVAIVTFDGYNEIDSFVSLGLINRLRPLGVQAEIASPIYRAGRWATDDVALVQIAGV